MGHVQASKIFHCLVWNEPAEKPKILLKTKSSGKTTFLWISNNITLRSQKNLSILVKSIKKNWGPKLGLNFPLGCAKGSSEILTQPIIGPFICTFWMPSFSFWVFVILNFTQKKQLFFLVHDPIGSILVGLGNNSSKQCQIELRFWPPGVLISVQMPFKVFLKSQIFTETWNTQNLSFWSNFDSNLPVEDG